MFAWLRRLRLAEQQQEVERIKERSERMRRERPGRRGRRPSSSPRPPHSGIDPGPDFITSYGDPFDD
jgi:hypothetical protein